MVGVFSVATSSEHDGQDKRARFPRSARLLKPADFKRVFNNPLVSSDSNFRILARANELARHRLGMAVSRKFDRRAVGRNRIKRLVRESFRAWCASNDGRAETGFDLVVLPGRQAATICNRQLLRSLDRHWSRIGDGTIRERNRDNARARN